MENKKKERYEKPNVTKIKLDPQTAVLGFCKNKATFGPAGSRCRRFRRRCRRKGS